MRLVEINYTNSRESSVNNIGDKKNTNISFLS